MPRTKGSKKKPKVTNDYASQIVEKQSEITTLTTEIASIQKAIEEQKNTLKEKKSALMLRPLKKLRRLKPRVWLRDY